MERGGKDRAVTVKLPGELYQTASDFVSLTGVTLRDLLAKALEKELNEQIEATDGASRALAEMRNFRQRATAN